MHKTGKLNGGNDFAIVPNFLSFKTVFYLKFLFGKAIKIIMKFDIKNKIRLTKYPLTDLK